MAIQSVNFDDIATSCGNLKNLACALDETSENTRDASAKIKDPTWDGEAARSYASDLKELVGNLPEANRQLALSVLFLASCADGYEKLGNDSVNRLKEIIGGQEYIDNYDVNSAPTPDLSARVYTEPKKDETETENKENTTTTTTTTTTSSTNTSSNSSSSSNRRSSSSSSSSSSVFASTAATAVASQIPASTEEPPAEQNEDTGLKKNITKIEYTPLEKDKLDETGQKLIKNDKYSNEDGLAKIGDYYLISCNESIGKPGDVIKFTLKDGKTITCIVVSNTTGSSISFIKDGEEFTEPEQLKNLLDNSTKVENIGNCKEQLGIDPESVKTSTIDMENYPKEPYDPEAALERGTLVAKYLVENGDFTKEQAAALAGVFVNDNGCNPGEVNSGVTEREKIIFGNGYGVGIGSWTTTSLKNAILTDAGYPTDTKIESLSLKEQCDMIIETSKKSNKTYYDALKRCNSIEDASATAAVMTGGVGFSSSWETHPTESEAIKMADYYAEANDRIYGYSEYHHNYNERRIATANEILERLNK
jgi:hypothetical protein